MIGAAACGHGYDGRNDGGGGEGEEAVLEIRDILVRIRIPGSEPMTNGSGSGSNSGSDSLIQ